MHPPALSSVYLLARVSLAVVFSSLVLSPARADNTFFWAEEVGGNVVFHYQGSIDLTGFPAPTPSSAGSLIVPMDGDFAFAGGYDLYDPVIPNTPPFGSSGNQVADSSLGDEFAVFDNLIAVPQNYVSQTPISGAMTFLSTTIAALGVNPTPFTIKTFVGDNTIYLFTSPAKFAADLAALKKKIRKLQKRAKKLRKKGKKPKAKKLEKKVRQLKRRLSELM